MDWLKIYRHLAAAQDALQQLEQLGVPRDRAIIFVAPDRTADLEISNVIEQLRDLEPKADPAGADGTDDVGGGDESQR